MPDSPLTREDLYALVWAEPMLKVAARFDVSSSYLARISSFLNVPRPQRGYWAKLNAGKAPPIPPLPEPRPGDDLVCSLNGHEIKVPRSLPRPPSQVQKRKRRPKIERPSQHFLVAGAKQHFESGRLSFDVGYLKPAKWTLIDLAVTKAGLDKALTFANELFFHLEELFQIINDWAKANQIEQFFRDAEQRSASLSEVDRNSMLKRLQLVREMIGSVDALDHFMAWRSPEER